MHLRLRNSGCRHQMEQNLGRRSYEHRTMPHGGVRSVGVWIPKNFLGLTTLLTVLST